MTGGNSTLSRRAFVGKLAAGAAVAATAGVAAQAVSAREQLAPASGEGRPAEPYSAEPWAAPSAAQGTPPWELLQPLSAGSAVTPQWHVAELSGVLAGSCVLTLGNARGRTQRVHLCANDGRPQGLVHTELVDLVVMNGGQGELPTEEGFAQAVAAVAHVIAANEARAGAVVSTLMPHAERLEQFAAAQLR
jgi:hypothetical protein